MANQAVWMFDELVARGAVSKNDTELRAQIARAEAIANFIGGVEDMVAGAWRMLAGRGRSRANVAGTAAATVPEAANANGQERDAA